MTENITLEQTLEFIKEAHAGQIDKGGHPYWMHPSSVMKRLPIEATDAERHAALLHDVVEDTDYTFDDLRERGYSEEVINILKLVTRDKSTGMTYIEWIRYIAASGNIGAIRVKIADNEDNSDPVRIAQLPPEMRDIINRYNRSLRILRNAYKELVK